MNSTTPYEKKRDLHSPNRNISPITSEIDQDGELMIGGCKITSLAERYGTPLYVLDEDTIRLSCRTYVNALDKYYSGDSLALYASKANSSIVISRIIASENLGLDAVSEGELITALKGGVPREKIVFHGNNKSYRELVLAYQNNVNIVVDNQYDLDRLKEIVSPDAKPARLMLRFTPGIECHTHEYIRTGHLDSKFGFDPDLLNNILLQLKDANWAQVIGLHAHIGSQIFEIDPHQDLVEVMIEVLAGARKMGHPITDLNVGGGLGIRYVDSDDPPSIDSWVEVISRAVSEKCKLKSLELPRLLCEPGRSLIGPSGITIYKLGSRKDIPGLRSYLSVDGGMSDNPRPITYQSLYTACLANRPLAEADEKITIAGKHCESGDIVLKDILLPSPMSEDLLVVFSTGAYNSSMSSNYNRIPRPAGVIVKDGQADLVLRRERPEDLLQYDVIPDRFIELN